MIRLNEPWVYLEITTTRILWKIGRVYNGLTVLMLMLSSDDVIDIMMNSWLPGSHHSSNISVLLGMWCIPNPHPPSEREGEMARCMRCARQISPSWYEKPSWIWPSDYNSLLKYGLPIGFYHSLYGFLISGMYSSNNVDIWQCNEQHNGQVKTPMKSRAMQRTGMVMVGGGVPFYGTGNRLQIKRPKKEGLYRYFS